MHLRQTINRQDAELDAALQSTTNGRICVKTYRAATTVFRAVAIGTIVATAIDAGITLSPTAYVMLALLALGPDVAEAYLTR